MFSYPASYTVDEASGEYHIHYRDFPELNSVTYSLEDVELEAQEGIKNGVAAEMEERRLIPAPQRCSRVISRFMSLFLCA